MDWPGEKVLVRLIDTFEKGIGGALRPMQIRRVEGANSDARAKERILLAQVELDVSDIKSGRKRINSEGKLISNEVKKPLLLEGLKRVEEPSEGKQFEPNNEFALAAKASSDAQALQQSVNLKKIALFAEEEAEKIDLEKVDSNSTEKPAQEIDEDWLSRWRTSAQDVKREEMQRLWANLLTGEVAQPGSFSLHTVSFLSRMSGADAELLSKLAPFQTTAGIIRVGNDFFDDQGLNFNMLMHLVNIGLISGLDGLGVGTTVPVTRVEGHLVSYVVCNRSVLRIYLGQMKNVSFDIYPITKVGREILSLAKFPSNDAYLQMIADIAIKKGAIKVEKGYANPNGKDASGFQVVATKS